MRVALFVAGVAIALSTLSGTAQERMLRVAGPWEIAGIDPAQSALAMGLIFVAVTASVEAASAWLDPRLRRTQ
ncbi:MAG: hypothetical protein E5X64_31260 [Mesorhizobium sp.]|uniref:hypothetical protein n=1 Tax=Mesorhizobium sp. TaxID=1871066 RepID=UPI000FE7FD20|nr:hypothetical protein [Mesorhizobium sp.]RWL19961.1 MAG: hypothetical protein EOR57_12355 [Mesorhizobium sp.]TIQ11237.1 MAG: hypothetical protein E5X61_33065 [Mesorhizobium sp.]TIQ92231.1 MAG: hypothetical protein E5X64_31260 [Mesorhizobium sp.]